MDNDYLDILKKTDLRPGKIKVEEKKEVILCEQDAGKKDLLPFFVQPWFLGARNR